MSSGGRLRVLLVSQQLDTVRSGVGTYVRGLLAALGDHGVDATCLTPDSAREGPRGGARVVKLARPSRLDPTPGLRAATP